MATPVSVSRNFEFVIRRTFWFPMVKMIVWNLFSYGLNMGILYSAQWLEIPILVTRLYFFFHFVGLAGTIWILLNWNAIKYTITNKKIVIEKGILNIDRNSFLFRNIECVKLHKNILGRMCWFGTIEMYAPTLQEYVYLRNVAQARKFFKLIQKSIAEHRSSGIVYPSRTQQRITTAAT